MTFAAPRFAMLAELEKETTSQGRRELMRRVTEALDPASAPIGDEEIGEFDTLLAAVASDYSTQMRVQIAALVAAGNSRFTHSAQHLALDEIEVARAVLERSEALSEDTLLKVIGKKSQEHMMAVTRRASITPTISHALVEHGSDEVVSSLLTNEKAQIGEATFARVAQRAENSPVLHAPLIRRAHVPVEILNGIYMKVETELRREIMHKMEAVPAEELERAFKRSREKLANAYQERPEDFAASQSRIDGMLRNGALKPPVLVTLLREGKPSRTAFKIAFAALTEVEYDLMEQVTESRDFDAAALLCRAASFDRALFIALAVGLDSAECGLAGAEAFVKLYESVPVQTAQRAIRFWKIRHAA